MAALQHARLYQGPDHLLQVVSTGYSEVYKRFYFRDIQAIIIQKTHWGKIWNGIWAFFTAMFGLPAFDMSGGQAIAMGSVGACFGLFLIGNIVLGPTCACFVRTAVQTERLSPVTRSRTARRFLKRIRLLIDSLQGSLSREDLLLRLRTAPASTAPAPNELPIVTPQAGDLPPVITPENRPIA